MIEREPDKKGGEFLFEVIMRRHELRSTVMTSNRPIKDWGKLLGDVPLATAILDRFLQHAVILGFFRAASSDSFTASPLLCA